VLNRTGDTVYVVAVGDGVHALDTATGELLWTNSGTIEGTGSPALAEGLLYVPGALGLTYVFDAEGCGAESCEPLWQNGTGRQDDHTDTQPTVAGTGETAILLTTSSAYRFVDAYPAGGCDDPQGCIPIWSGTTGDGHPTTPAVVSQGRVFVGTDDGLVAFGLP
jgi:outer membrane protein assembly factor BamB